jgi:imidazolonepropionase
MKLQGYTYMDIHKQGGGIGYTVKCVRSSSIEELDSLLVKRLNLMISNGTTLVEAKSGYG